MAATGKTFFDFVEKHITLIIAVVVLIIIALVILVIVANSKKNKASQQGGAAAPDGQQPKPALTYPRGNYAGWADALEQAIDTAGTDESAVTDILKKMQTDADVSMLANLFGTRYIAFFAFFGGYYNLWGALQSEGFTGSYADEINQDWETKGITYSL